VPGSKTGEGRETETGELDKNERVMERMTSQGIRMPVAIGGRTECRPKNPRIITVGGDGGEISDSGRRQMSSSLTWTKKERSAVMGPRKKGKRGRRPLGGFKRRRRKKKSSTKKPLLTKSRK